MQWTSWEQATVHTRVFVSYISLLANEGTDEGFGSPRNALVLPNGSETRPEVEEKVVERWSPRTVLEAGDDKPLTGHLPGA